MIKYIKIKVSIYAAVAFMCFGFLEMVSGFG